MVKREYLVSSSSFRPSGLSLPEGFVMRTPAAGDKELLAALMLDSFRGTIDDEGESLEDAIAEIARYLGAEAYLAASRVADRGGEILAAVLMSRIAGLPVVGYVMTRADYKGRGFARVLLDAAVATVWQDGHDEVEAFITAGNRPSEAVFTRAGFEVVADYED
jgi:RimJ/RimL family protein N-acetyltransferase